MNNLFIISKFKYFCIFIAPYLLLLSCDNKIDKNNHIIVKQQKTIDSLQSELNQYKILYSVGKEIIESDSSYTE
jgi:hypothetical protein